MIVRINTGRNPAGAVRYNEEKVAHGEAKLIGIHNYPFTAVDTLSIREKITVMEEYAGLNRNVTKPTLHLSIAYHPSEKLDDQQMQQIGEEYLEKMGYGKQPCLLYRHEDTNHPHLHIVTVSINDNGQRISDSNNRYRSNKIRQELEKKYNLVKAEEQQKQPLFLTRLPEQTLNYGKEETKKAIGNLVRTAFTDYSFSSTETFAQFLASYNIQLNQLRGESPTGKPYQGISFQLTNGDALVSPAIKASSYSFAPTQERLDNRFKHGRKRIDQVKPHFLKSVQTSLEPFQKVSAVDYKNQLRAAGIQLLDTGKQFMYVDHNRRVVYHESEVDPRLSRSYLQNAFVINSQLKAVVSQPAQQSKKLVSGQQPETQTALNNPAPKPLSEKERITLSKQVGQHYQAYRKEAGHYFESQTIEKFPFEPLTKKLQEEGVELSHARAAVRQFEVYKQSQLPDIKSKEESYFLQTGGVYLKLASQMPITAHGRNTFLESVNLQQRVDEQGQLRLVHRHNPALQFTLTPNQHQALRQEGSRLVTFPRQLPKADRDCFLAVGSGQVPETMSFYGINAALLKSSLPAPVFDSLSTTLNKNYLQQVIGQRETDGRSLAEQLLDRGIILETGKQGFRAGYYQTHSPTFTTLPPVFQHQLDREGLPVDYPKLVDRLQTPAGRLLVEAVQSEDSGHSMQQQRIRHQLAGASAGLTYSEVVAQIRQQFLKPPTGTSTEKIIKTSTTPAPPLTEKQKRAKALQDALWKDYFQFRAKQSYFYESALLQKPAEFPINRMVHLLTSHQYALTMPEASQLVVAFYQHRLNRLDTITQRDEQHFVKTSQGFLTMVNQAPLSGRDRQQVLKSLYLDIQRNEQGQLQLVHGQHRSFRIRVSEPDAQALLKGAAAEKVQSVILPGKEFPRHERALYEQIVLGQQLTKPKEAKESPTFRNVMGERVKVLLSEEQWKRASQLLNENTTASLLKDAPLQAETKLDWLYQRGMVIAQTPDGLKMGHYLTDQTQYTHVPPGLVKLLETYQPAGAHADHRLEALLQTKSRLSGLSTERGKAMLNLAQALDQNNRKRIDFIIDQLIHKVPELAQMATQPETVLAYLSTSYGSVNEYKLETSEAVISHTLVPVLTHDGQGGLLNAIAEGADTTGQSKKQRINPPRRRLNYRR